MIDYREKVKLPPHPSIARNIAPISSNKGPEKNRGLPRRGQHRVPKRLIWRSKSLFIKL